LEAAQRAKPHMHWRSLVIVLEREAEPVKSVNEAESGAEPAGGIAPVREGDFARLTTGKGI
jgi:hypothetical protein